MAHSPSFFVSATMSTMTRRSTSTVVSSRQPLAMARERMAIDQKGVVADDDHDPLHVLSLTRL